MSEITGWLIFSSLTVAIGSSFLYGYNVAKLNTPMPIILKFYNQSFSEKYGYQLNSRTLDIIWSATVSVYVGFGAVGSFTSGWLADLVGRKRALLLNHILAIIGAVLEGICKVTNIPELLIVGRMFIGLNCGMTLGLATMYLTEISPQSIRGAVANLHQVGVVLGILVAQILGLDSLLGTEEYWPILCAFTGVTPLLSCFILPFCPESPRYLLLNKEDEAGARLVMEKTIKDPVAIEKAIVDIRKEYFASSDAISRFHFSQLFKARKLRMALMVCTSLMICQQWSGINAMLAFSGTVFEIAGVEKSNVQYAIVGTGVVNMIFTFINLPLMEKAGRRNLLLYPSLVMLLSMFLTIPCVYYQQSFSWMCYASIALIHLYIIGFALGLGPIPCMLTSETFRQGPRGAAVGIVQGTHWAMNLFVTFTFTFMQDSLGAFNFLVYGLVCIGSLTVTMLFLPETMGRSLDEIILDFKRGYMQLPCLEPRYMYDNMLLKANKDLEEDSDAEEYHDERKRSLQNANGNQKDIEMEPLTSETA